MASDAPIWPLINLLRLKRAVGHCRHCGKVAYYSRWDAQAIADLTFVARLEAELAELRNAEPS